MSTQKTVKPVLVNLSEVKPGDIFSECSYYKLLRSEPGQKVFMNLLSKEEIAISNDYVENFLYGCDQFHTRKVVNREDSKDGTPGIRTIWENIKDPHVLQVSFMKKDEAISKKKLEELRTAQLDAAIEKIERAKNAKKNVLEAAKRELLEIQNNPITGIVPGDLRILRGYKVQFESRDGRYDCVDFDITEGSNIRPVNINTIVSLVYKGVLYTTIHQ